MLLFRLINLSTEILGMFMKFSLTDICFLISFFQLIVFIIFLFFKKQNKVSNYILGIFFICQLLIISGCILSYIVFPGRLHWYIYYPVFWLVPPVLYFYVKSVVQSSYSFKPGQFIHALPFLAVTVQSSLCLIHQMDCTDMVGFGCNFCFSSNFIVISRLVMYLQFLIYCLVAIHEIGLYRIKIKDSYSSLKKINLIWLNIVIWGFMFSWLINCLSIILYYFHFSEFVQEVFSFLNIFSFLVFFNIIFFKAWTTPDIFNVITENIKYQSSELDEEQAKIFLDKLLLHMQTQKPYINSLLTINVLSEQLSIPVKTLSQVINENLHQNFYDFVNAYRTEEVKQKLSSTGILKIDLVSLGMESGFNSKASFFRVFKKNTGQTPKQYFIDVRKNNQNNIRN
jgi:AraC-like DNA-binding protein